MKKLICFVCLAAGIGFIVSAQTNFTSSLTATNMAPFTAETNIVRAATTNASPTELRATEISSQSGQFNMKSNVFVYLGDVRVDNPQMKLRCELLTLEQPKLDKGEFKRATALTNVVIDWVDDKGTNHATSDKAVYTYQRTNSVGTDGEHWATNETIVLIGNPFVTDPKGSTFQGDPINYDRTTGTISSTNALKMKINQEGVNSPGFFETTSPKTDARPK